jgi:hypothetical protein
LEGRPSDPEESKLVKVNLDDSTIESVKIKVNNRFERTISIRPINVETEPNDIFCHLGDRIIGEFDGIYTNPRIQNGKKQTSVPYQHTRSNNMQVMLSSQTIADMATDLLMDDFHDNTKTLTLDYHALHPGKQSSYSWFDSSLVVLSNTNSVTDTTLITAEKHQQDSSVVGVPTASYIYEIKPNNFHLFESISISIRADSIPQWGQWSIYKTNGEDRFSYLPANIDSTTMFFTAKTSSIGKFIVAADTVPPEVLIENPKNGKVYKSNPKIKLFVKDSLSGIGGEDQYSLSIDGNYVLPEYDPEEDFIIGIPEYDLASGNHIFSATVRDRSGNVTRQAVYFKIQ